MSTEKEDRIKKRAHTIWEREGGSHGEHERHWHQATQEIEDEDGLPASPDTTEVGKAGTIKKKTVKKSAP